MYHPSRGGVRGGRDRKLLTFATNSTNSSGMMSKVDKHRENYVGHSIMAPVGRWQKGKDLHWYTRDKKAAALDAEAAKEEIRKIKEEEEQAMREALGLAPKRTVRNQGNKLDKYEYAELTKRGSTAEDLGAGHAEAAQVQGLGLYKGHRTWAQSSSVPAVLNEEPPESYDRVSAEPSSPKVSKEASDEDRETKKKRRREERREEREKRHSKHDKKRSHDSDEKHRHRRDRERRRHDSDSD